jgi:hypothetical protein
MSRATRLTPTLWEVRAVIVRSRPLPGHHLRPDRRTCAQHAVMHATPPKCCVKEGVHLSLWLSPACR